MSKLTVYALGTCKLPVLPPTTSKLDFAKPIFVYRTHAAGDRDRRPEAIGIAAKSYTLHTLDLKLH